MLILRCDVDAADGPTGFLESVLIISFIPTSLCYAGSTMVMSFLVADSSYIALMHDAFGEYIDCCDSEARNITTLIHSSTSESIAAGFFNFDSLSARCTPMLVFLCSLLLSN